jgi:membrane protein DedA with SNARE-associated domain/rhodanese-related sulfurtransferase
MTRYLLSLIGHYGLLIVVLNVLLDMIGLPVPALPALILAGAVAADGQLSAAQLMIWSVVACLVADCGWYLLGEIYGIRVLKTLCRISLEPDSCVSETQSRFERWGMKSLLIAKFVPGLAIIAPPLAGAMRIGWLKFTVLSTGAAILWVGAGLAAGMLFKSQIEHALANMQRIGGAVGLVLGAAFVVYLAYKWWERRRFLAVLRMARISVAALYDLINAGAAPVVIDVRSPTARALEPRWIPGAVHVPLNDIARHVKELPRDREIIVYCTCPNEASAARVAKILMRNGFKSVRPLHGGLDAWISAGYVVEGRSDPPR